MSVFNYSAGSSGIFSRTNIPPGQYILRVVARTATGDKKVVTNSLLLHRDEMYCAIYLINRGWRVEGKTFVLEFSSTGVTTQFVCSLNREEFECKSGLFS